MLRFDKHAYTVEEAQGPSGPFLYRAFRNIPYVDNAPLPDFQRLNLFVPESYYHGGAIHGFELDTAPVFLPNTVGGYMPGPAGEPGTEHWGPKRPNAVLSALRHGYVVACPGIRGRSQQDAQGRFVGKAPACIVDYKAAVAFLHFFAKELPGDENRIISNGTSAGGALSALLGATGDHLDYKPYLKQIGAADASDAIFAVSCYCPITDLSHADMAYEWQFGGLTERHRFEPETDESGRVTLKDEAAPLTQEQKRLSAELSALFPAYLNSLSLRDVAGRPLTLEADGSGSFRDYLASVVLASAQDALDHPGRAELWTMPPCPAAEQPWLRVENGRAVSMDFAAYARAITRLKGAPAFDPPDFASPETDLFGCDGVPRRHFSAFAARFGGPDAEEETVRLLDPLPYIGDADARTAKHWRIRHGECDRDTSLAVSAILALRLRGAGADVDYFSPWNVPHAGDYDLTQLFAWIDAL